MLSQLRCGNIKVAVSGFEHCPSLIDLQRRLEPFEASSGVEGDRSEVNAASYLEVYGRETGIHMAWHTEAKKPLQYHIDINAFVQQQRSFPAPKQGAFNQALGKKTRSVIDATGGWGGDALLMCAQGYQVTVIERNPIMATLLEDAMQRLRHTDWAYDNPVTTPTVVHGNAIEYLGSEELSADCVYLDPMFPAKRKKSAAVNKQMQLLQLMLGEDSDADQVLSASLTNFSRVAVKRPDYAQPLLRQPDAQFSSKLVHYDVYFA